MIDELKEAVRVILKERVTVDERQYAAYLIEHVIAEVRKKGEE